MPGDLKPGDVVRVRPGDNIPADGLIVSGDEHRQPGQHHRRIAAGRQDRRRRGVRRHDQPDRRDGHPGDQGRADDTTLGRVKDLILQAERTRIPIMRMIDRYAGWYTPTILMLVGIVLFFTRELTRSGGRSGRSPCWWSPARVP